MACILQDVAPVLPVKLSGILSSIVRPNKSYAGEYDTLGGILYGINLHTYPDSL